MQACCTAGWLILALQEHTHFLRAAGEGKGWQASQELPKAQAWVLGSSSSAEEGSWGLFQSCLGRQRRLLPHRLQSWRAPHPQHSPPGNGDSRAGPRWLQGTQGHHPL